MQNTLVTIADGMPTSHAAFRAFTTLRPALRFLKRAGHGSTVVVRHYTSDARDVRYVVNYRTAPRSPRKWSYDRVTARATRRAPAYALLLPSNLQPVS